MKNFHVEKQILLLFSTYLLLLLHNTKIKQVNWFSYLGSLITSDGKYDREIKRRIAVSREAFSKMKKIL